MGTKDIVDRDGDASATSDIEVTLLDDVGPVVLVDGQPHRIDPRRLRLLGRQAIATANALEGVPLEDPPVLVQPFARIFPPRLPVEAGIPDDLWICRELTLWERYLWMTMWRLCPHLTGRPPRWRGRVSWLAKLLFRSVDGVYKALSRLEAVGWVTVIRRAERPSGHGEIEVVLHLQRRVDATVDGVIETTAEPREP